MFVWGKNEVVSARVPRKNFAGLNLGEKMRWAQRLVCGGDLFAAKAWRNLKFGLMPQSFKSLQSWRFVSIGICETDFSGRVHAIQGHINERPRLNVK